MGAADYDDSVSDSAGVYRIRGGDIGIVSIGEGTIAARLRSIARAPAPPEVRKAKPSQPLNR